jgi:hypothetical protein
MHKIITANENKVLYKVEEAGRTIKNLILLNIQADSTIRYISNATVYNGNYIKLVTSVPLGTSLIFMYDIQEEKYSRKTIDQISQEIEYLKKALLNRITANELSLYIEKLKEFNTVD